MPDANTDLIFMSEQSPTNKFLISFTEPSHIMLSIFKIPKIIFRLKENNFFARLLKLAKIMGWDNPREAAKRKTKCAQNNRPIGNTMGNLGFFENEKYFNREIPLIMLTG